MMKAMPANIVRRDRQRLARLRPGRLRHRRDAGVRYEFASETTRNHDEGPLSDRRWIPTTRDWRTSVGGTPPSSQRGSRGGRGFMASPRDRGDQLLRPSPADQ